MDLLRSSRFRSLREADDCEGEVWIVNRLTGPRFVAIAWSPATRLRADILLGSFSTNQLQALLAEPDLTLTERV